MKVSGTMLLTTRQHCKCPDDGVHVATKDGMVSSTHAVTLGDILVPKGSTAFYVRNKGKGFKVFYGLDTGKKVSGERVMAIANAMEQAGRQFCPRVHGIVGADIDVRYRDERIQTTALALCVEHVHWPDGFEGYVRGLPYIFDEMPEHNPDGFKRFVKKARKVLGDQEYKLGNVLYNTRLGRWMLVDVRVG